MERSQFSTSQKSASEVKCENNARLFFDSIGVVHSEFVSQGHTVNQKYYLEVLKMLLNRKPPSLWQTGEWLFHHDNAPAHTVLNVQRFLTKNVMTPLPHSKKMVNPLTSKTCHRTAC
jgi:hypothetical protein